jgi:xanthine dehydrogenase accessory factor
MEDSASIIMKLSDVFREDTGMEDLYRTLTDVKDQGKQAVLAIVVRTKGSTPRKTGAKMIIIGDGSTHGTLGGGGLEHKVIEESLKALKEGNPKLIALTLEGDLDMKCGGEMEIYIEPVTQPQKLVIFGSGHITGALAPLMQSLGFVVTVVDHDSKALEEADTADSGGLVSEQMESYAKGLASDPNTYIVILTRGYSGDMGVLEQTIAKDFRYVGMVGSAKKIETMKGELRAKGVGKELFSKLSAPIGLDIGAETPEEIALSIAAEIISVKQGKGRKPHDTSKKKP